MRYWDSSAVVPLLVDEAPASALLALLESDAAVVAWWGTPLECVSAIARREREGHMSAPAASRAVARLRMLASRWHEVLASDPVRETAFRLLRVHSLRAADSLQLAAAIVAADGTPGALPFVCLDERLAEAAEREGFPVQAA